VVAHGHAAADLDIDHLVDLRGRLAGMPGIGFDQFADQVAPFLRTHRVGDPQLGQAAVQPGHVLGEPERPAGIHRHHFVDPVAEDEAAVEHADLGVAQGAELAVEPAGEGGE